jgi:signal transduction histidine kinase
MALLGAGTALVLRRAGTSEAIRQAGEVGGAIVRGTVQPNITEALADGNPAALAQFDRIMHSGVLGGSVVRLKLWSPSGRIVYSDEPSIIGKTFELEPGVVKSIGDGKVATDISELSRPENLAERAFHKLLEVYAAVHTPGGRPLMFETYLRFSSVEASGQRVFSSFFPALVGSLLLLELLQLPLAVSLARRIREGHRQRELLLRRAIEASDNERRRIAADLHDGVVQTLAGVSYSLAAATDRLRPAFTDDEAVSLHQAALGTRESIQALRALFVEIYPPNLQQQGLHTALTDLLSPLASRGIDATLHMDDGIALPGDVEALMFRITQEAIRNIVTHASPCRLEVQVGQCDGRATLDVVDDGPGFVVEEVLGAKRNGHMGLLLMGERASDAGGNLAICSAPGAGTRLHLETRV